jgi:hypothetical protein
MNLAWTLVAGLAIGLGAGLVVLVGQAMTRSDRDLRGFVDFNWRRPDERD